MEFFSNLVSLPVFIQCTWANAYTEPLVNRGLCIISYDRITMKRDFVKWGYADQAKSRKDGFTEKVKINQLGFTTGYATTVDGVDWIEVYLFYSNRRNRGWMRLSDIWISNKETEPNPWDWPYIPYSKPGEPVVTETEPETKKSTWAWITGALALLSILK